MAAKSIRAVAAAARMLAHVVELTDSGRPTKFSKQIAREGGGRNWMASEPRQLRELFGKVSSRSS